MKSLVFFFRGGGVWVGANNWCLDNSHAILCINCFLVKVGNVLGFFFFLTESF